MNVKRLPNGKLLVPRRAESEDGTIGDSVEEIGPGHPDYRAWMEWLARQEDEDDA